MNNNSYMWKGKSDQKAKTAQEQKESLKIDFCPHERLVRVQAYKFTYRYFEQFVDYAKLKHTSRYIGIYLYEQTKQRAYMLVWIISSNENDMP